MVSELRVTWATCVPILVFLGLCVLELFPMYATDRQIDVRRQTKASLNASALTGRRHNNREKRALFCHVSRNSPGNSPGVVLFCFCSMNSVCDSSYLSDDSLHEMTDISQFLLSSAVAEHVVKTEPADVVDQVSHVTVTSRAPASAVEYRGCPLACVACCAATSFIIHSPSACVYCKKKIKVCSLFIRRLFDLQSLRYEACCQ